jgi:holo-[acyl-carrier protein] synthase
MEGLLEKFPERFINRTFTATEQLIANKLSNKNKKFAYYAKRFAAKEACSKAIGTGIRCEVSFLGIEITNNELGRPEIKLLGKTKEYVNKCFGNYKIHVTISDDKEIAFATVILEQ